MSVSVKCVEIEVDEYVLRLTLEEARSLRDQLNLVIKEPGKPNWSYSYGGVMPLQFDRRLQQTAPTPAVIPAPAKPCGEITCSH